MRYRLIEEMQKDFDINSYNFYMFFHQGEICVSPKIGGLDSCSFFIPFVGLSNNKLYLDGLRNASFQPTALYFPFTFKHSISKKICKIKINKNYV